MSRYWPLERGRIVTSPFGPRDGGYHYGTDFGFPGGSASKPVYAIESGTVTYCGAAQGYGGPAPAGWIVISGRDCYEYGHIVAEPHIQPGAKVQAGEQIAVINPNPATNGGTSPHLHLSYMKGSYNPNVKTDPMPTLAGALEPPAIKEKTLRPDFNEYPHWSPNNQRRNGTKVDLFLLHTQEGPGNADSLGRYLRPPAQVSYHYTVSQDPKDNGVTVVDIVDTDLASWSVLSANNRSINLCFAGSSVNWSRDQWMRNSKAIDAAAWLAVQDCKKYGIPTTVIAPPYTAGRAGISDHAYVTKVLKDGSHSDVGPNFPWQYFATKVAEYAGTKPVTTPVTPPKPENIPTPPAIYTDRQLLESIWRRIDGLAAALEKANK